MSTDYLDECLNSLYVNWLSLQIVNNTIVLNLHLLIPPAVPCISLPHPPGASPIQRIQRSVTRTERTWPTVIAPLSSGIPLAPVTRWCTQRRTPSAACTITVPPTGTFTPCVTHWSPTQQPARWPGWSCMTGRTTQSAVGVPQGSVFEPHKVAVSREIMQL